MTNLKLQCSLVFFALLSYVGCSTSQGPAANFEELDASVCAPSQGSFTLEIDNEFFPLPVGRVLELEGDENGTKVRLVVTVLDETEEVAGVTTRVVEETAYEDDELVEFARNFFAQASDGTVCYFGEDVDNYEDGKVDNHNGTWRAGEGDNLPGIIMPASPRVETKFAQEKAPGVAEDMSAIVGLGESTTVPAGEFSNVLHALDWNPLDGQTSADGEDKKYAPGIGLIFDNGVELVSMTDSSP